MAFVCTICSDSLLDLEDDRPATIPCGHTFHKKCLITWINLAFKCPICSKKTKNQEVISPIYLSGDEESVGKSTPELRALLQVARLQQKDKDEALKESRIANKFLQEELRKYKALATSASKSNVATTDRLLREREIMKNELAKKQHELAKMKNEKGKLQYDLMKSKNESSTKDAEIDQIKELLKSSHSPFPFTYTKAEAELPVGGSAKPHAGIPGFGVSNQAAGEFGGFKTPNKAQPEVKGFGASIQPATAFEFVVSQPAAGLSGSGASKELKIEHKGFGVSNRSAAESSRSSAKVTIDGASIQPAEGLAKLTASNQPAAKFQFGDTAFKRRLQRAAQPKNGAETNSFISSATTRNNELNKFSLLSITPNTQFNFTF